MTIDLASKIKGKVVVPGDEGYAAAIHRWAINAEKKAAVVVQVTSPADVAEAVLLPSFHSTWCLLFYRSNMRNKPVWKLRSVVENIPSQGLRLPRVVS